MNKRIKKKKGLLIDTKELVNLDKTLATYILPRIKRFREVNKDSYPADLKSMKEWNSILSKIEWSLEYSLRKTVSEDEKTREKEERKYKKGMKLFAEYFEDLWL